MTPDAHTTPGLVAVAGGGIGGLAASIALRNAGVATQVFERAARFAEVGVAVGITPNGLKALDALGRGIGAAVRRRSRPLAPHAIFPIRTPTGHTLATINYGSLQQRHGAPFVTIRRVELHAILREAHGESGLNPGCELVGLHDDGTGVTARFAHGLQTRADVLVGADGLRSTVRTALFGTEPPRHLGASLRGIARGVQLPDELAEGSLTIGRGLSVFSLPLGAGEHHWTAVIKVEPGSWPRDVHQAREALLALVGGWSFPVPDLISSAAEEVMVVRGVHDRPPRTTWSRSRVTLLGDAAHPMSNSLGQGANTALEDAVVLARCLAASHDPAEALRAYEQERIPRTTRIVLRSAETSERSRAGLEANPNSDDFADWLYGYSSRA